MLYNSKGQPLVLDQKDQLDQLDQKGLNEKGAKFDFLII